MVGLFCPQVARDWMYSQGMGQQVCVCGGSVLSPGSKRLDVQLGNESTGVCVWWVCSVPR